MNKYIIKKEFREALYHNKGMWMLVISSGLLSVLCFLVCTLKEGNSLAQGDVLQYAIKAIMFITLTVSMVLGATSFISEKEENTLESLLLTPVSKRNLTFAKFIGVLVIGFALYFVSIPYLFAVGLGSSLIGYSLLIIFVIGSLLLLGFAAIGQILSIYMKSSKASILVSILILITTTLPAFVQGLFKSNIIGRIFLRIDPISNAYDLMNNVLINQQSFLSQFQYYLPIIGFTVIMIGLLVFCSKDVALKGEK